MGQDGRDEEAEDWTEVMGGLSGFGLLPAAFQGLAYAFAPALRCFSGSTLFLISR